jgi:hypothetical protein
MITTTNFYANGDLKKGVSGRAPMNTRFENTREDTIHEPKSKELPAEDEFLDPAPEGREIYFDGSMPPG